MVLLSFLFISAMLRLAAFAMDPAKPSPLYIVVPTNTSPSTISATTTILSPKVLRTLRASRFLPLSTLLHYLQTLQIF